MENEPKEFISHFEFDADLYPFYTDRKGYLEKEWFESQTLAQTTDAANYNLISIGVEPLDIDKYLTTQEDIETVDFLIVKNDMKMVIYYIDSLGNTQSIERLIS